MKRIKEIISDVKYRYYLRRYRSRINDLVHRGMILGRNVTIGPSAWFDYDYCYLISVGDNCTISKGTKLIAHDATTFNFVDHCTRIGRIEIRDNCYLGENTIILPGVTIGPNVLVAAGSVVNKDIPPNSCVAGNPARFYGKFDEFVERHREQVKVRPIHDYALIQRSLTEDLKKRIRKSVEDDIAYVKGCEERFLWLWNTD